MKEIWIYAEVREDRVNEVAYELLTRALDLKGKLEDSIISAVLMGRNIPDADKQELIKRGADRVYYVDNPLLKDFVVEPYSKVLIELINRYKPEIIIAPATTQGRTLMPYTAVRLQTGLTADCTGLDIDEAGNLLQTRPAIGGNVMATIRTSTRPQMATVRPHSTRPAPIDESREGEVIEVDVSLTEEDAPVKKLEYLKDKTQVVTVQDADIVVSGGRGIGRADNFKIVYRLAELLGGAVGASRDVVDRGWITYPHQVGLSGKTVNPKVYIALGISGSIQHLAGMQTSETIIAINKDPDAQIFRVSDLGIVGDLHEVVPVLIERLEALKNEI
ncbi:MAG: electron transfer flavoprotein subunit alpha/FixB family protein [Thermoanaerobacteraceae bacterium]|nr:electron transfer flavoprotein subunit alpha/FixB family protein [Thermoanaerobacteraceae bacterium]